MLIILNIIIHRERGREFIVFARQCILVVLIIFFPTVFAFADNFTRTDRDRLVRMETRLDTSLQQIDRRFEQLDRRFDDMFTFLWILTGIFTTLTVSSIGFAYWDRRTSIRKAKDGTLVQLIQALRELAKKNKDVARVLRMFNLL